MESNDTHNEDGTPGDDTTNGADRVEMAQPIPPLRFLRVGRQEPVQIGTAAEEVLQARLQALAAQRLATGNAAAYTSPGVVVTDDDVNSHGNVLDYHSSNMEFNFTNLQMMADMHRYARSISFMSGLQQDSKILNFFHINMPRDVGNANLFYAMRDFVLLRRANYFRELGERGEEDLRHEEELRERARLERVERVRLARLARLARERRELEEQMLRERQQARDLILRNARRHLSSLATDAFNQVRLAFDADDNEVEVSGGTATNIIRRYMCVMMDCRPVTPTEIDRDGHIEE